MTTVTHPLIRPGSLETRDYQLSIAMHALEGNTMVVLPTGLGKTAIALLVAASRLHGKGGKVLMLAPTKPLAEQHFHYFSRTLLPPGGEKEGSFVLFTGESPPEERTREWEGATACFATPQVIKNDCIAGRYDLSNVSLLIIDECHRAVGNYPYVFLAGRYRETAADPLVLAMTASPGSDREKVTQILNTLGVEIMETRTENDPDVRPYVHEREMEVITVSLPPPLHEALRTLRSLLSDRLAFIRELGIPVPNRDDLSMKEMNLLNAEIQSRIQLRDSQAFQAASLYAECMKLRHAIIIAGSQGSTVLRSYLERLRSEGMEGRGSRASIRLAGDPRFRDLLLDSGRWEGELHPKLPATESVVQDQVQRDPGSRIIVFTTYRDSVELITTNLRAKGISCERFIGQAARDTGKGLSQKMQIDTLNRFRAGEFRVLVSTSVGEEGLDVPSTDLVIFYEAVPSEIRSIQRKGRTGRNRAGRIVVLVTKGTMDEAYRFISQRKERTMQAGITRITPGGHRDGDQTQLPGSPPAPADTGPLPVRAVRTGEGPPVTVDDRETATRVVEHLSNLGAVITLRRLDYGDYAIGDRVLIERKTTRDFVDTLVERDLLGQVGTMARACLRPVLIIEGENLYTQRDIHPNAIRGALSAISLDLGVSLFFTRDEEDTARMIEIIARREYSEGDRERVVPGKKNYSGTRERQEAIIASFPDIGLKGARALLRQFGSVRAVIDADEHDLTAVEGIGPVKAKTIAETARRPYS